MAAVITFGTAARESMSLMTASPGVLYNVDGVFRNGPAKGKILPGFNLDTRKPLAENLKSTTAAIYSPKLATKVPPLRLHRRGGGYPHFHTVGG